MKIASLNSGLSGLRKEVSGSGYRQSKNISPSRPAIQFRVVYMTAKTVAAVRQRGINLSNYSEVQRFGGL